jgi:hypothetical protein
MMKWFRDLVLGFGLLLLPAAAPSTAFAYQAEAPAQGGQGEGEGEGWGPVPGYIATGMFAFLAMFILCKSARR